MLNARRTARDVGLEGRVLGGREAAIDVRRQRGCVRADPFGPAPAGRTTKRAVEVEIAHRALILRTNNTAGLAPQLSSTRVSS